MKSDRQLKPQQAFPPPAARAQCVSEIRVSYEGIHEDILVKPPNLSRGGMFISTNRRFPEGAVLNLRFRLTRTGKEVQTRAEVRHCQPGVGIGVEFIGISPDAQQQIMDEIGLGHGDAKRPPAKTRKPKLVLG